MVDNVFKVLYLLVAMALVAVLFAIYQKQTESRYEVINQASGVMLFDKHTNEVYFNADNKWHVVRNDGRMETLAELPK
jgi:hypothetical protein